MRPNKYFPPVKYTPEDLDRCARLDLESDLAWAVETGATEHAEWCRAKLARIAGGASAHTVALEK